MSDGSVEFDLRRLLSETHVSELTLTVVPLLSPDQTLEAAAAAMREVSHGSALICQDDQLVGIITERDLLRLVSKRTSFDSPVSESMTSNPKTLSSDDALLDAVRLMDGGGYRRLPVVGGDACAVGIVDVKTIMTYVVEHVPATVYNQASHALLSVRRAEGA
ncbi:MAG: CBS domain-containing protein [Planctomycetaceae bacterium]|nr:CBS domain-containing protein [Planctomycetaceae bacterium]